MAICLMVYSDHINLGFFHGAKLADRFPQMVGTGKSMRHLRIPTVAKARAATLARLVRAAERLDAASAN